jgi:hypothetical protein
MVPTVKRPLAAKRGGVHVEHATIAVDLAKSVFQLAVSHRPGHLDEERRRSRDCLLPSFAQRPPATIVLAACGSAHTTLAAACDEIEMLEDDGRITEEALLAAAPVDRTQATQPAAQPAPGQPRKPTEATAGGGTP